jgi:Bacterial regulatory proteins, lacI family
MLLHRSLPGVNTYPYVYIPVDVASTPRRREERDDRFPGWTDQPRPGPVGRVSQSTVSRVLTNHPRVSEETRARVRKVLQEQNFIANSIARAMKTGRTETIGAARSCHRAT